MAMYFRLGAPNVLYYHYVNCHTVHPKDKGTAIPQSWNCHTVHLKDNHTATPQSCNCLTVHLKD